MKSHALPIVDSTPDAKPRGRLAHYALRVSLLEQCQLRCRYCMPGSVQPYTARDRWLSPDEIARVVTLLRARGLHKVRLTGGEPLLRDDVVDVVAALRAPIGDGELALTTNGVLLSSKLDALREAGLARVTVHIDTLRDDRYEALMGTGASPGAIVDAVARARATLDDVKLNVVVQRGANDDELLSFLALSRTLSVEVRFIEQMNTGSAQGYVRETFMSGRDIVDTIARAVGARARPRRHASDPAALYVTDDDVTFGVIASDTEPFCADCDRLRLTSDGRLRGCLYESTGAPLGALMKAGASDAQLAALIDVALTDKRSHHPLVARDRAPFSMADVGG